MLVRDLKYKPYPLTRELASYLNGGAERLWDKIIDAIVECREHKGDPTDTDFYHNIPVIARSRLNARYCGEFLNALDLLVFKMFSPVKMRLNSTAEELLLHWIMQEAVVSVEYDEESNELTENKAAKLKDQMDTYDDLVRLDTDYLYLFDPKWDGIDTTKIGYEMSMQSLNPNDWFESFHADGVIHPFNWSKSVWTKFNSKRGKP